MQSRLLCLILTTLCASAGAQVLFQDGFNGSIQSAWTITRPDTSFYTINATGLDLRCSSLDIDVGPYNNAMNLFTIANPTPTNGDFVITMKFNSFIPADNNHAQVCIIVMDDEDNFVRANYGFINGARRAEFGKEVAAGWSSQQTALDLGTNAFFLRLTKTGKTYTQSYSTNGTNYAKVNSSITFGDGSPARLGFASGADPSESSHALIDSFTVEMPMVVTIKVASVQLSWLSATNITYQPQWASSLSPTNWVNLGSTVSGTGAILYLTDSTLDGIRKFYRVVVVP